MATDDTHGEGSALPKSVVADILANDRRRIALEVLAQRAEPMVIDDLAATVRARELDIDPAALSQSERRSVRDRFFAEHLPKLTATGVVEYDSMVGTLVMTDERVIDRVS